MTKIGIDIDKTNKGATLLMGIDHNEPEENKEFYLIETYFLYILVINIRK